MTETHSDPAKDFWSWTWTTPMDQVLLARTLAKGGSTALTDAQCRFTYDLMGQVQDDQTWGIGQPKSRIGRRAPEERVGPVPVDRQAVGGELDG